MTWSLAVLLGQPSAVSCSSSVRTGMGIIQLVTASAELLQATGAGGIASLDTLPGGLTSKEAGLLKVLATRLDSGQIGQNTHAVWRTR